MRFSTGCWKIRPLLVEDPNSSGLEHIRAYEQDELKAAGTPVLDGRVESSQGCECELVLATSVIFFRFNCGGCYDSRWCLTRDLFCPLPGVREYWGRLPSVRYRSGGRVETSDTAAIRAAHDHMLANPIRELLKPQEFLNSIAASNGYGKALWTISRNNGHGCTT